MTEDLKKYLTIHGWNKYTMDNGDPDFWTKDTCSQCYSIVTENKEVDAFVYSEDCPDVWKKVQDFPPDIIFDSEAKLMEFLEKLKLTNWP